MYFTQKENIVHYQLYIRRYYYYYKMNVLSQLALADSATISQKLQFVVPISTKVHVLFNFYNKKLVLKVDHKCSIRVRTVHISKSIQI
jgi:hypothetical protein